ncbi:MAG: PGF-pre-PGF domain-containing protein [Methanoregula sp.]|jgi:predicted outer membrane repeat protein|nr:PGF-pre-PGF domain-containing protein [Methanoregula sp.]
MVLVLAAGPVSAGTINIVPNDPDHLSINATIHNASAGDTIILGQGTYVETGILVDRNIRIQADTAGNHGPSDTIIDGTNSGRIMKVNSGVMVTIDNLTFTRGSAGAGYGGAIYTDGTVIIASSMFTSCKATGTGGRGGAIYVASGTVTIGTSSFSGCAADSGGAISVYNAGTLTVSSSTFTSCQATYGGAIYGVGDITITGSRFSTCSVTWDGGAVYATYFSISSSTFSGCTAGNYGGAIYSVVYPEIVSSTFSGCIAGARGGAIFIEGAGLKNLRFSRFYQNSAPFGSALYDSTNGYSMVSNWWSTNSNPSGSIYGTSPYNPWLVLGVIATPATITAAQTSFIGANLTYDYSGAYHDPAGGHIPNATPVTFDIVSGPGSLSTHSNTTTLGGSETTFIPFGGGTTIISATVDGQTVTVPISVAGPSFTGTPMSGTAPLAVAFTDASTGSPTMWNWSFGDGQWYNTTVAMNPVHTYAGTGTYTVNLTTTIGGTPFTLSRAGYITASAVPVTAAPTTSPSYTGGPASDSDDTTTAGPRTAVTTIVNVGGNSAVHHVAVTGTGLGGLIVTGTVRGSTGTNIPPPPGIVYQYIDLVPARFTTITGTTITFTVPLAWLDEHHMTPQDIAMYHSVNGQWVALPTTVVSSSNGIVTFSATSPGFSLFAIAGTPGIPETSGVRTIGDLAAGSGPAAEGRPGPQAPVVTQTTAAPVPAHGQAPDIPLPLIALAGILVIAAGGFVVRRWWIRRQNPALFQESD